MPAFHYAQRQQSREFELSDPATEDVLFTMDVDVNRPIPQIQMYEIADVRFLGASPVQMIADKLSAVSTGKVFRRIKDVVDLYYIFDEDILKHNRIL